MNQILLIATFTFTYSVNKSKHILLYKNLTKSHSLPTSLHMDSIVFEEDFDKANAFNEYFHSVFTQSSFILPDINDLPSVSDLLLNIT